ncbi:MAG: hypothetical protein DWQ37_06180 [Planctomycetota bacterium]|nr:MAG: hypothetical protein DWQ37_06180 [Planctomycetota bacterium]
MHEANGSCGYWQQGTGELTTGDTTVVVIPSPPQGSQQDCGQQGCGQHGNWAATGVGCRRPNIDVGRQQLLWKQPDVPAVATANTDKYRSLRIVLSPGRKKG